MNFKNYLFTFIKSILKLLNKYITIFFILILIAILYINRFTIANSLVAYFSNIFYSTDNKNNLKITQKEIKVMLNKNYRLCTISDKFLSFTIDTSLAVGGYWWSKSGKIEDGKGTSEVAPLDFLDNKLIKYTKNLSPAYLRIGGTEADVIYYDMSHFSNLKKPPKPYEHILLKKQWDNINKFIEKTGLSLFFTVNAGPSSRNNGLQWQPDNFIQLLTYSNKNNYKIDVWELGNEINVYWFIYGLSNYIDGYNYANDIKTFKKSIKEYYPKSKIAGPSSMFWPLLGEIFSTKYGVLEEFLLYGGKNIDIITWHYYPQQSRRCSVAVRRASVTNLLNPNFLNEVDKWAAYVEKTGDLYAPGKEVWLGETGNAQAGGEPGVSNTYVSGLWWLDQLGLMARRGHKVVVRQTLVGSDYGLLNYETLAPNPDYWNSLLWKKLMGKTVLQINKTTENPFVRIYAHCTPGNYNKKNSSVTFLMLNQHETNEAIINFENIDLSNVIIYECTAKNLTSSNIILNGNILLNNLKSISNLKGKRKSFLNNKIVLKPASYSFIVVNNVAKDLCNCDQ